MSTTTLNVPGMTCNHCVMTVNRELGALPGAESVQVDLGTHTVVVIHNESLTLNTIEQTLAEAGYPAQNNQPRGKSLPLAQVTSEPEASAGGSCSCCAS